MIRPTHDSERVVWSLDGFYDAWRKLSIERVELDPVTMTVTPAR